MRHCLQTYFNLCRLLNHRNNPVFSIFGEPMNYRNYRVIAFRHLISYLKIASPPILSMNERGCHREIRCRNGVTLRILLTYCLFFSLGCANITSPTGGKRDIVAPKLLRTTPNDSLLNTRLKRLEIQFDEYVTINDPGKEVTISPLLPFNPNVTGHGKTVTIKIADTLLEPETTYRISLGNAIKDLHEGNVFSNYTYTFSTGSYFDSLELMGIVQHAETGKPDSTGKVLLYSYRDNDSAIVRKKPMYIAPVGANGRFHFKGLPPRKFKIYALKDGNDNLVFDDPTEMVAFHDTIVTAGDTTPVVLRLFQQLDTTTMGKTDSNNTALGTRRSSRSGADIPIVGYVVNLDTTDKARRSFDINQEIAIRFAKKPTLNTQKVTLFTESGDTLQQVATQLRMDTLHPDVLNIGTTWLENTVYTLKLTKGFAKDSAGTDLIPGKYTFRTKEEDDYGKIKIHVPAAYLGKSYLLSIKQENEIIYEKPLTDSLIALNRNKPGKYTFRLIGDKNQNGKWDTGNLLEHQQPEAVIAYPQEVSLKAGWEQVIDFGK